MTATITRKRPEQDAGIVLAGAAPKVVDKRFTSFKAAAAANAEAEPLNGGVFRPTPEQLDKINEFTKRSVTADDVVVLPTMSANDIRDRDNDMFKTACIRKFAGLPAPYSPVGKPYMVGHDTSKLPIGRIFDTGTQRVDDNLFLTNQVYVPNTDQYKNFIENVEFGVYWAVSVGVMLGAAECTIGKAHDFMGRYWCSQGHEKGLHYDPNSAEKDDWGWPEPVDPSAKGAVLCGCDFDDPTDFYELSQVYLGAQYFAELGKDPEMAALIKSAHPLVNLGAREAESFNISHIPSEVVEARANAQESKQWEILESSTEFGDYRWKDAKGFIWGYDPSSGDVLCYGVAMAATDAEKQVKELRTKFQQLEQRVKSLKPQVLAFSASDEDADDDPVQLAQSVDATLDSLRAEMDQVTSADDDEHFQQAVDLLTSAESSVDELVEALGGTDADEGDEADEDTKGPDNPSVTKEGEGAPMSKKAVQTAAKAAGLPSTLLDKLAEADEEKALDVLLASMAQDRAELTKQVAEGAPFVEAGKAFVEDLQDRVRKAYVRAKQSGTEAGVNTDRLEKLIKLAGNDTELLSGMLGEYEAEHAAKHPGAEKLVVRSSFPKDSLEGRPEGTAEADKDKDADLEPGAAGGPRRSVVSRIHAGLGQR